MNLEMELGKVYSVGQLAEWSGLTPAFWRLRIRHGDIAATRLGSRVVVRQADLEQLSGEEPHGPAAAAPESMNSDFISHSSAGGRPSLSRGLALRPFVNSRTLRALPLPPNAAGLPSFPRAIQHYRRAPEGARVLPERW